jgi:hypothetical protein
MILTIAALTEKNQVVGRHLKMACFLDVAEEIAHLLVRDCDNAPAALADKMVMHAACE